MTSHRLRVLAAASALAAAAALSACHPAKIGENRLADRPVVVPTQLECPERKGDLERASQAPDGKSCTYRSDDGEEVTLALLPLGGKTPTEALAPTEASFRTMIPPQAAPGADADTDGDGKSDKVTATLSVHAGHDHGDDDGEADGGSPGATGPVHDDRGGRGSGHDHVAINLPGVHIDANDGGASIHAFGQNVVADDNGAVVQGSAGGVNTEVKASDDGAEIRAGRVGRNSVDLTFILASDAAGADGAHAAAYIARGPVAGPLVLATATLKKGDRHADQDDFSDARRLVNLNVRLAH